MNQNIFLDNLSISWYFNLYTFPWYCSLAFPGGAIVRPLSSLNLAWQVSCPLLHRAEHNFTHSTAAKLRVWCFVSCLYREHFFLRLLLNQFLLICTMLMPDKNKILFSESLLAYFKSFSFLHTFSGYNHCTWLVKEHSWICISYFLHVGLGRGRQVRVFAHGCSSVLVHLFFLVYSGLPCAICWSISVPSYRALTGSLILAG